MLLIPDACKDNSEVDFLIGSPSIYNMLLKPNDPLQRDVNWIMMILEGVSKSLEKLNDV